MSVRDIFGTMDYGPAPESAAEAMAWLAGRDATFGHWIDGAFAPPGKMFETRSPGTGTVLARVTQGTPADIDTAVAAARRAQPGWAALSGHARARVLYALARMVQRHARLFAVMESLDAGKPIRESRDIDVPLVARHLYYHAGLAQLAPRECPGMVPLGVCAAVIPWNFPLLILAWKVAPALAAGNAVVLKPAEWTPLTALIFAQMARDAGLPDGLLNVVTGDGDTGAALVAHAGVDKVAFTGSTGVGREVRRETAGTGRAISLELGGKSPYVVFEDADLDSAVEGLVDAIWFNGGQVCCAGSRLLVQEGVADRLHDKLRARMDTLRTGDPLDKGIDVGAIADPVHRDRIAAMVDASEGQKHVAGGALPGGCFYPPTLVTGLHSASPLMREEVFGPVLASMTFRTPDEAAALANDTAYGLAASVWTESVGLALDMARRIRAGIVWINGANMMDAAAGFGGVRESGFGRDGGWEGFRSWMRPAGEPGPPQAPLEPFGRGEGTPQAPAARIDRTAKLLIGGRQVRADGGHSRIVHSPEGRPIGSVGLGNRKDIRNAVEAAHAARAWGRATAHLRAQVLYYVAENLSARAAEFAERIASMTGQDGTAEVDAALDVLFTFAAWADKFDGAVKPVPMQALAMALHEPVGVIGAICPDAAPLLGLVALMAPALAMGNACVMVPSRAFPLAATDLAQVLDTSDLPGGAVNIVTGDLDALAQPLAAHMDVDAVWCHADAATCALVEREAAGNLKRTWTGGGRVIDWARQDAKTALREATAVKTVWVPYGV